MSLVWFVSHQLTIVIDAVKEHFDEDIWKKVREAHTARKVKRALMKRLREEGLPLLDNKKIGKRKTKSKSDDNDYLVHGESAIAEAERYIRQWNRELTRMSSKEERLDALYLERMECEEALRRLTQGKQHYFDIGSKSADPIDHIWYWERVREAVSERFSKEKND